MNTMGKLAGKTIFITGASRGIGKVIALRCAEDGANIVIAAKTADPHPKLPGTIYTAAKEIEAAGGKCLPCVVDIRYEDQVKKAVQDAVSKFGGIDILVNNASAISLTTTEATSMSRYDLMNGVNARGTFMCSKICMPYLKKASNPHILNISPPLNLNPRWFQGHVAYTMAKYGMSFCVLGMAEEFKADGVAVNALWPRTAIYTAAMEMLGGGEDVKSQCRSPDIMSDAAYVILTKDSKQYTGNFTIDDEVLATEGITDFTKYQYDPNTMPLPDFFLDYEGDDWAIKNKELKKQKSTSGGKKALHTGNTDLDNTFKQILSHINADVVQGIKGTFQFDFKDGGRYFLDLKSGDGHLGSGDIDNPDVTMTLKADNFVKMASGELNPTTAFMSGKLKIEGNLGTAMKLEKVLKGAQAKL